MTEVDLIVIKYLEGMKAALKRMMKHPEVPLLPGLAPTLAGRVGPGVIM